MDSEYLQDDENSARGAVLANAHEAVRAGVPRLQAPASPSAELLRQQPGHLLQRYAYTFRQHTGAAQEAQPPFLIIRGGSGSSSPDPANPCPTQNATAVPLQAAEDSLAPASAPTQPMRSHTPGLMETFQHTAGGSTDDMKAGLPPCSWPVAGSSAPLPQASCGSGLPVLAQRQMFTFDEQKFLSAPLRIRSSGGEPPDWEGGSQEGPEAPADEVLPAAEGAGPVTTGAGQAAASPQASPSAAAARGATGDGGGEVAMATGAAVASGGADPASGGAAEPPAQPVATRLDLSSITGLPAAAAAAATAAAAVAGTSATPRTAEDQAGEGGPVGAGGSGRGHGDGGGDVLSDTPQTPGSARKPARSRRRNVAQELQDEYDRLSTSIQDFRGVQLAGRLSGFTHLLRTRPDLMRPMSRAIKAVDDTSKRLLEVVSLGAGAAVTAEVNELNKAALVSICEIRVDAYRDPTSLMHLVQHRLQTAHAGLVAIVGDTRLDTWLQVFLVLHREALRPEAAQMCVSLQSNWAAYEDQVEARIRVWKDRAMQKCMAHAQQQVLSRLQLAANPEGGEAIVLRPRSAPTPVATAGTGYHGSTGQPSQPVAAAAGQPPAQQPPPPPPPQRGAGASEGAWPFGSAGDMRPSGGPSGGTTPRAATPQQPPFGPGSSGDAGGVVGGPGALTPSDLVPLAEVLQEHERFRVVALQTLQARLTPLEFAQYLLSRSEISSSAGSLMAAADTFAPVDAGGTTRRPAAAAAAAAAGAVASFLRPAGSRP
eukprot:jgi/Ulvmu1/5483/UM023_0019.1